MGAGRSERRRLMPLVTQADRAIVVGISNYPKLGIGGLSGPVKDAHAMADWLQQSAGAHVTLITSEGRGSESWTVSDRRPNQQDIEDGFDSYILESMDQNTMRIGRRLYVYMAGHGFAPEPRHLALITANALRDVKIPNIQATSWIDWFADQLYFDECVLWMDCCAERTFLYDGGKPLMKKAATRQNGRAKVFMAFAAGPSVSAFEGPIGPNGEIRGLFTDRLLRGLKGAAADASGTVRTSDLMVYLKNQQGLIGNAPTAGASTGAAFEPVFPETADLILAQGQSLPTYSLKVALPDGTTLTVLDARQTVVDQDQVTNGVVKMQLPLGIFKAVGPGLSTLFEIASGTTSEVDLA
jgi:hypothetical protein